MSPSWSCCCDFFVRSGTWSPAAAIMSAMCAPVPPEIAYTHTLGWRCFFAHAGSASGIVRANDADTSRRSSSPSTRVTPN